MALDRRAHDYPWRLQLDKPLSLDCRGRLKNRQKQFVIDGEAVILGVDGISDFDAHSGMARFRPVHVRVIIDARFVSHTQRRLSYRENKDVWSRFFSPPEGWPTTYARQRTID